MTEITVKIRWPQLILALLLGPGLASTVLLMASIVIPPAALIAALFIYGSLALGYVSYLILYGPLMIIAQKFGFDHPIFHALLGLCAVWMIPPAHAAGIPYIAGPDMVELGQWFGPAWCAAAAATYTFLCREFSPDPEAA